MTDVITNFARTDKSSDTIADKTADKPSDKPAAATSEKPFNPEAFALNVARAMESSGQALAAYLKPRQSGEVQDKPPSELAEVIKTFSSVAEYWMADKD